MIILGDSNITDADISATNGLSFAGTEKLQIFQLSDKFKTTSGTTQIILDFGACTADIDTFVLCGTNISTGSSLSLSYSDTDPAFPETTISLPTFTSFNQIWMLDEPVCKRYWIIDIDDPDPQDSDGIEIGFIYCGERTQSYGVSFPHSPSLNLSSVPDLSATGQGYGSKGYNATSMEFTIESDKTGLESMFSIVRAKQNIDPIVIVPFEDSLYNSLYPPMYGTLNADSYGYPMDGSPGIYAVSATFAERF